VRRRTAKSWLWVSTAHRVDGGRGAGRVISQIGDSDLLVHVLRSAQTFASQSAGSALRLPGISCQQRRDAHVYTR